MIKKSIFVRIFLGETSFWVKKVFGENMFGEIFFLVTLVFVKNIFLVTTVTTVKALVQLNQGTRKVGLIALKIIMDRSQFHIYIFFFVCPDLKYY